MVRTLVTDVPYEIHNAPEGMVIDEVPMKHNEALVKVNNNGNTIIDEPRSSTDESHEVKLPPRTFKSTNNVLEENLADTISATSNVDPESGVNNGDRTRSKNVSNGLVSANGTEG